jgi:hypothetical protein
LVDDAVSGVAWLKRATEEPLRSKPRGRAFPAEVIGEAKSSQSSSRKRTQFTVSTR